MDIKYTAALMWRLEKYFEVERGAQFGNSQEEG